MMRLKSKLLSLNASKPAHLKTRIFNPANCEEVRIPIRKDKIVKVVGKLAESIQINAKGIKGQDGTNESDEIDDQIITGAVLVENDLKLSLMDPEDLQEYAGLEATTLVCRQKLTLAAAGIDLIRWALEGTFGGLVELGAKEENSYSTLVKPVLKKYQEEADEEISRTPVTRFRVMDTVMVTHRNRGEIEVEWVGNMMNDGIADAVLAVLLSVESSPAAVKRKERLIPQTRRNSLKCVTESSKPHSHSHSHPQPHAKTNGSAHKTTASTNPHGNLSSSDRLDRLLLFLEAQFGSDNVTPIARPKMLPIPPTGKGAEGDDSEDKLEAAELARLHALGIPVPGVEIRVDASIARVWLEDLSVECEGKGMAVLKDRVKAVVERGVECIAPLWAGGI